MDATDRLESLRGELVRSMAHDLRTPLNGVLGLGELVALSGADPTVRRYGELIRESGGRLQLLLEALLDLAQLSPRGPPDPRPCRLPELLSGIAACHAAALQRHGLSLTVRAAPDLPRRLRVDRPRLAFLLHMLVRDGIARAIGTGTLALCAAAQGGGVSLTVRQEAGAREAAGAPAATTVGTMPVRTAWDGGVADRLLGEIGGRCLAEGGAERILWFPTDD